MPAIKRQAVLFLVAVQFLTRLPVPHVDGFHPDWLSRSARYFPLVGILIGWISVGVWRLSSMCFPPFVAVGLMMAASLLLTGAFHEDGFADVCDGFGGGTTSQAVLSIMKDSRIGAYGAIGIVMMLGLKWATLISLPPVLFAATVIAAHMVSRWCAIGLIWRLQYVRWGEDAKSKTFADALSTSDCLLSGALGVLGLLPMALFIDPAAGPAFARTLLAASVSAMVSAGFAGAYFKARIGGYTGDCLGAAQQISELCFLLAALAAWP